MWEGLDSGPGESGDRLPNGAESTEQNVSTIPVSFQAEFAAEFAQSEDSFGRPAFHDVENELCSYQD